MLPTLASALSFRSWLYFHHLLLIYPSARTVAKAEGLSAHSTHHDRSFTHKATSRAKRGREDLLPYCFVKLGSSPGGSEARSFARSFYGNPLIRPRPTWPRFLPPLRLSGHKAPPHQKPDHPNHPASSALPPLSML